VVFADTDECAEGAKATVALDGATVAEGVTNNYGDAVLDGLERGREYTVTAAADGYQPVVVPVQLHDSRNLGTIILRKV
jgi:hypothetical protein